MSRSQIWDGSHWIDMVGQPGGGQYLPLTGGIVSGQVEFNGDIIITRSNLNSLHWRRTGKEWTVGITETGGIYIQEDGVNRVRHKTTDTEMYLRRITSMADGTGAGDAVTLRQLTANPRPIKVIAITSTIETVKGAVVSKNIGLTTRGITDHTRCVVNVIAPSGTQERNARTVWAYHTFTNGAITITGYLPDVLGFSDGTTHFTLFITEYDKDFTV